MWDSVGRLFRMQASRRSVKVHKGFSSIGTSLSTEFQVYLFSAGIPMWVQTVWYNLFSSVVFLPYFSMLILSLPFLQLGSKATFLNLGFVDLVTTSLSPGFCVGRPRQYNTIFLELNLISWFFAFFWLIFWADGINKCGWCLAGGRGCWLKVRHQILSVSWIFLHSLHFHIY